MAYATARMLAVEAATGQNGERVVTKRLGSWHRDRRGQAKP